MIKCKKKFHNKKIKHSIGGSRNVYKLLNYLKGIINTSSKTKYSVKGSSGNVLSDKLTTKNIFNAFFFSIGLHLAHQITKIEFDQLFSEPCYCIHFNLFAIVPFLEKLTELSFISGCFPTALAQAVVYHLYKAGYNLDISSYRPISLLVT